jgi:hypothetical protein
MSSPQITIVVGGSQSARERFAAALVKRFLPLRFRNPLPTLAWFEDACTELLNTRGSDGPLVLEELIEFKILALLELQNVEAADMSMLRSLIWGRRRGLATVLTAPTYNEIVQQFPILKEILNEESKSIPL